MKAGQEPVHLATVWGAGAQLAETLASQLLATAGWVSTYPCGGGGKLGWCGWWQMMGTLLGPERTTERT